MDKCDSRNTNVNRASFVTMQSRSPRALSDVTCESEAAMLERNKLARAPISRLLHKCYFSRRSERRAPSIPRALKRNEKHASESSRDIFVISIT